MALSTWRIRAAAALAAMLVVPATGAHPSGAFEVHERRPDPGSRVRLAGTTVIAGRHSAMVPLSIPRPVQINVHLRPGRVYGPNPSVKIEGDGRIAGFAITRDHPANDVSSRFLTAVRFARCRQPGCAVERRPIHFIRPFEFADGPNYYELPAGKYRLYLIADGAPVRITLRFVGLPGRTVIRPRAPATIDVKTPASRVNRNGDAAVYSAGDVYRSGQRGFFIQTLFVAGRPFQGAVWGMCAHPGPPPPADAGWYGPHCSALGSAGLGSGAVGYFSGGPNHLGFWVVVMGTYSKRSVPPAVDGRRVLGAWFASQGRVRRFGTQGFYLSYDL